VSANAGAGKTKVLTDRVVRLLLAGAQPGRILCLTFTKAARRQHGDPRVSSAWALGDPRRRELIAELTELEGSGRAAIRCARPPLFARAVETPGG
jgi:ATP-dependent helicase/nuclease subunit A